MTASKNEHWQSQWVWPVYKSKYFSLIGEFVCCSVAGRVGECENEATFGRMSECTDGWMSK